MSAELRDILLESRFIERAPAYFGRFLRKAKAVAFEELGDMLDRGVDEGLLTEDEALEAINCGLVVRGLNRSDGSEEYLLVEVSWEITTSKVKELILLTPPSTLSLKQCCRKRPEMGFAGNLEHFLQLFV